MKEKRHKLYQKKLMMRRMKAIAILGQKMSLKKLRWRIIGKNKQQNQRTRYLLMKEIKIPNQRKRKRGKKAKKLKKTKKS